MSNIALGITIFVVTAIALIVPGEITYYQEERDLRSGDINKINRVLLNRRMREVN